MADGKFKHPQKVIKVDRTTEEIEAQVPPKIIEHYKYVHLDLYILYLNSVDFFLENSRNIRFIHCKEILSSWTNKL